MAIVIACAALLAPIQMTRAQNLIQDPFFTNPLPASGSTDSAGNTYYTYLATPTTFDGVTGIDLAGSQYGYFEIYPVAGYDPNGVNYVFTFLAAAVNPAVPTTLYALFAYTTGASCGGCGASYITETLTSSGLTQYTLTGTSSNIYGNTGYLYVQAYGGGDVFVTGLDFQPAPAPVAGGGILSFCVVLAGLALHRMRRRGHPIVSA